LLEQYKKLSGGEKLRFKSKLKKRDEKVYNTFSRLEKDDRLGMSKLEKNIKELEPGVRAEYIADILRGKTQAEVKSILKDYADKGIVTDQVKARLREIGFKAVGGSGGFRTGRTARKGRTTRTTRQSRY